MPRLLFLLCAALLAAGLRGAAPAPAGVPGPAHAEATVEPARTSIYVGRVTLETAPFRRIGERYESTYSARVFPFFFYSEQGRIAIDLSDDDLRRLTAGEPVAFSGRAESDDGDLRRVEGRAAPSDADSGTLKVRIHVSPRIELVFDTRYRFSGASRRG